MEKSISAECSACESTYEVSYVEEIVSTDLPEHCPFCGETIDELSISEDYIDDSDDMDEEWDT